MLCWGKSNQWHNHQGRRLGAEGVKRHKDVVGIEV
jgi:hypothetical protein